MTYTRNNYATVSGSPFGSSDRPQQVNKVVYKGLYKEYASSVREPPSIALQDKLGRVQNPPGLLLETMEV